MKILLVDDDSFVRGMYADKFSQAGHAVDAADNGGAALLKLAQTTDYDVVMMDMVMPGMTGLELLQKIKEEVPDLKSKLVVLSNQGQEEEIREATEAGAHDYIIKAQTIPSEVLERVEALCGE